MNHFKHVTKLGSASNLLGDYFLKTLMNLRAHFSTFVIQQSCYSVTEEAAWNTLL